MVFSLANGRTLCSQLLDDVNNREWSTAQIDVALAQAGESCLSDYVTEGGAEFDEDVALTSTNGVVALSTLGYPVLTLKRLQQVVTSGSTSTFSQIEAAQYNERAILDQAPTRSLKALLVRKFVLPTVTTDALVAGNTWAAFDRWVCTEAAMQLAIKDNDNRRGLEILAAKARDNVLSRLNTPKAWRMPLPRPARISFAFGLRYIWQPAHSGNTTLQLIMAAAGEAAYP